MPTDIPGAGEAASRGFDGGKGGLIRGISELALAFVPKHHRHWLKQTMSLADLNPARHRSSTALAGQYEPPPVGLAIDKALQEFITKRKAELPNAVT